MVRPSGGRATATAIPGARLVEIDGMGHDLPPGAWDRIVDAIVANARARGRVLASQPPPRSLRGVRRSTISRAGAESLDRLRPLWLDAAPPSPGGRRRGARPVRRRRRRPGPPAARSTRSSSPPAASRVLAERDGELIGYAMVAIKTSDGDRARRHLAVGRPRGGDRDAARSRPRRAAQGVGTALLDRIDAELEAAGHPRRADRRVRHQRRRDPALRAARLPARDRST